MRPRKEEEEDEEKRVKERKTKQNKGRRRILIHQRSGCIYGSIADSDRGS